MNQKTAKLLKRWASVAGQKARDVKRWWLTLDRHQRAAERRRMREKVEEG